MLVIPNCDAETFDVLDAGNRRQAAQPLKVPHAVIVAAAARIIGQMHKMWDLVTLFDGSYGTRASTSDISKTVAARPELVPMAPIASSAYRAAGINQPTHLVVLAQAARTEHSERIEDWASGIISGANMDQRILAWCSGIAFFGARSAWFKCGTANVLQLDCEILEQLGSR
ncbi:hypothetical protein ACIRRX_06670 [Streptomyces bacillaris]